MDKETLVNLIAQLPDDRIRDGHRAIAMEEFADLTTMCATYLGIEDTKRLLEGLISWLDDPRVVPILEQKRIEYEATIEIARLTGGST